MANAGEHHFEAAQLSASPPASNAPRCDSRQGPGRKRLSSRRLASPKCWGQVSGFSSRSVAAPGSETDPCPPPPCAEPDLCPHPVLSSFALLAA